MVNSMTTIIQVGKKSRLQERYANEIIPAMTEKFGYKNKLQVPRITKITINMGIGLGSQDIKLIEDAVKELAQIVGQKPVMTRAKKAISNFKLRKGVPIGVAVILRGKRMYEFFDRLISIALPRIRDFRGISLKSFDGNGNYSLGITEHTIFPELDIDRVTNVKGMTVTLTIIKSNVKASEELLRMFGMPFAQK